MKKFLLIMWTAAAAFAAIPMSDAQIKKLGITVKNVRYMQSEAMGPFIGTFDYGDERSYSYTLSSEATVVDVLKKPGDNVKKGEVICKIASSELLSSSFELKEINQRLKLAKEYAKKDEALYKDGVLSLRDSQKSGLEAAALQAKAAEIASRFEFAGADSTASNGMMFTIRAKRSGILSQGPMMGGEKIDPFVPYLKISDAAALNAVIMIPPKLISYVHKGSVVSDKNGNPIGKILSMSVSVNRMNNSGSAIARISKQDESFRAGTSAEMFIASEKKGQWVLLPRSSVTKYKNQDICFIRTDKGFEPKTVEVQKYYKDHVAVKSDGFTLKTEVVKDGIINLKGALGGMGFE